MKKRSDPWLLWKDTLKQPYFQNKEKILVIIPTAGENIKMLKNCLKSLKLASQDEKIDIVIILSPSTRKKEKGLKSILGKEAKIISLRGPFNYCRSINKGLGFGDKKYGYALFLNDDVIFTKKRDLQRLKETLINEGWACIGPFINYNPDRYDPTWPKEKSSLGFIQKTSGAVRTNLPVSGSCSLWDLKWLNKIGKLDEEFGKGWGMDEADLCIRALRLGARYGRQDSVSINHIMHATFGKEFTRYSGVPHMRSRNYFKKKYGNEVEEWGKSPHWFPLPGLQVIIFPFKNKKKFKNCLNKIEKDLRGFRWILLIADDDKNELTQKIIKNHSKKTSADRLIMEKIDNEKLSKNEILKRMVIRKNPLDKQYPAIYVVDPNKNVSDSCVRELLYKVRDGRFIAGKIGKERTIPECLFPNVNFIKFKPKSYKTGSIFHIKLIKYKNGKIPKIK
ncbi:MAG: glycosyltransferase [Candidatus Pacearchaeota archaeon]